MDGREFPLPFLGARSPIPRLSSFKSMAILGLCAIQLFLSVLDLVAAAHFGMWMGLSQKKPAKAVTKTVLYVLVFPVVAAGCVYAWPLLSAVKNIMFINYAQEKLRKHFRSIITERYGLIEEPELVGQTSARARRTQLPSVLR